MRVGYLLHSSLVFTLGLAGCVTTPEQDPMLQRITVLDGRILSIERVLNNQSLLDLSQRNDALQAEIRSLRGQLEQLQHNTDTLTTQQRNLYADVDKRVQTLEQAATRPVTPPAPDPQANINSSSVPTSGATLGTLADNDAYQAAFELLKNSQYNEALVAFSQFIQNYPSSTLADNAQYWLGETHYVLKDYARAKQSFQQLLDQYPNSYKIPDALLKLGFALYELKDDKQARATLQRLVQQFADTNAARLGQLRLNKMKSEGR